MPEIAIPPVTPGRWRGVIVDRHDAAGASLWTVTVRTGFGRATRRRWFPDRGIALAHGAEMADRHNVPLFDLSSDPAE